MKTLCFNECCYPFTQGKGSDNIKTNCWRIQREHMSCLEQSRELNAVLDKMDEASNALQDLVGRIVAVMEGQQQGKNP